MIKFRNVKTDFYTGKNKNGKQVVVCKIRAHAMPFKRSCNEMYDGVLENVLFECIEDKSLLSHYSDHIFTGKAVLADGDEYNEELGKKIAESKAKMAMHKKELQLSVKVIAYLNDLIERGTVAFEKRQQILEKEEAHYEVLLNETDK